MAIVLCQLLRKDGTTGAAVLHQNFGDTEVETTQVPTGFGDGRSQPNFVSDFGLFFAKDIHVVLQALFSHYSSNQEATRSVSNDDRTAGRSV